jgi:hypothetical protein
MPIAVGTEGRKPLDDHAINPAFIIYVHIAPFRIG